MNIRNFKQLIVNLPVRQQCFTTKRSTWENAEKQIEWLSAMNDQLFDGRVLLKISRQDIFDRVNSIRELILKTIYWGYTAGMRGNHFVNILQNIEFLEANLSDLKSKNGLMKEDFDELSRKFKNITGLGLSTYSKLLYFLNIKFNGYPCLILDQRLIDVCNSKFYQDYFLPEKINDYNKEQRYLPYLKATNDLAIELKTNGENIEQFLFIFGNNLKLSEPGI